MTRSTKDMKDLNGEPQQIYIRKDLKNENRKLDDEIKDSIWNWISQKGLTGLQR